MVYKADEHCHSLWEYLRKKKDVYINPFYGEKMCTMWLPDDGVLVPLLNVRNIKLWEEYYMKYIHRKERSEFSYWPLEALEGLMLFTKETNKSSKKENCK
jgi:hypothetical protein